MQHGPLQAFHLYLNQGIALVRYSTREEAAKAQGALNNCVLGNTTILADFANESDMQQFLQQSGHPGAATAAASVNSSWGQGSTSTAPVSTSYRSAFGQYASGSKNSSDNTQWNNAPGTTSLSQLWPLQGNNLWNGPSLGADPEQHRATPSSLNSFLPGDLLGSESV